MHHNNHGKENQLKDLMRQAQHGDHAAYSKLLHCITPLIRGFIFKRIDNKEDHDDILQEVLLGIHRASHIYNTDRPLTNWVFAIADHKLKDYLRTYYRKQSRQEINLESVKDFLAEPVTSGAPSHEKLTELLDTLPEKQKRIVAMMKIDGYTAQEVAEKMGMSVSNVKVTAHGAYQLLMAHGETKEKHNEN